MKVKERKIAKKGGYKATFMELIRPNNKVGTKIGKDNKKRILFRLVDDKDNQIPCGCVYDFKDLRTVSTLVAIGVPVDKMKELAEESETKALLFMEKVAKKKGLTVNVWVREDGSFGSGIRPMEGKFPVKFSGVLSRDKETKKPVWTFRPGKQGVNRKTGGTYMNPDINAVDFGWVVKSGSYKGLLFRTTEHYPIIKDEEDEWMIDADTGPGRRFKMILVEHKIDPSTLNPDKHFDDPENGLPELEKMMLKRADKANLEIDAPAGKPPKVIQRESLGDADSSGESVDLGEEEFAADPELISSFFAMIDKRVKSETDKPAWASDGELSKSGRIWVKKNLRPIMDKKDMPDTFEELDDDQVKLLKKLIKVKFPI